MTPHVSGWTEGMLAARAEVIAANIERVARGEPPLNLVASYRAEPCGLAPRSRGA